MFENFADYNNIIMFVLSFYVTLTSSNMSFLFIIIIFNRKQREIENKEKNKLDKIAESFVALNLNITICCTPVQFQSGKSTDCRNSRMVFRTRVNEKKIIVYMEDK